MVCVSGMWVGVDSAWEQNKLEARKMLVNAQNPIHPIHALFGEFKFHLECLEHHLE
jgi:hypothetical protein